MQQVLKGIRVIDWAEGIAAPASGYQLADLGAEVIKIEHPVRGDLSRGYATWAGGTMVTSEKLSVMFEHSNRGKKSIIIDLTKEEGKELVYRLVEKSDVFIHNHTLATENKNKMSYKTLKEYNQKIIYAHSFGLGNRGPFAQTRCFDTTGQGWSGMMWQTGDRSLDEPCFSVVGLTDQETSIVLTYGILAALVCRERTGIGQEIEVSMLGAEMFHNAFNINTALWIGRAPARHKRTKARNPLGNHYKCGDGKWILLSEIQNQRFWKAFCRAMGLKELENDSRFSSMKARSDNCEELIRILDEKFATKTRNEWVKRLEEKSNGMSFSIINRIEDLITDPSVNEQVIENKYIGELNDPRMDHPLTNKPMAIGCPIRFSETPVKEPFKRAPEYGEHTEVVFQDVLGFSMQEIEELKSKGIIGMKKTNKKLT